MSFLAPLFVLGALAIAAPIIFHLIRRTSREKISFSSLMFLQPTPPRVTRKSRLENILLLILRCAVLCLLALAFARPFLRKPVNAQSANAAGRTVILLDTSASMRREDLWTEAKAKALDLAREAKPGEELAILTFDRNPRTLVSFRDWTSAAVNNRRSLAEQRLATLKPTWNSTHLGNALVGAVETLESEREKSLANRRIFIISDMQDGARLDGLQGFQWPKQTQVTVVPVKGKRPTNAGVQLLADAGTSIAPIESVRVRVNNVADSKREQFELRWVGGATNSDAVAIYVPPGQSRSVDVPKVGGAEQIVLNGDEADFDNTAFVVAPRREQIDIAFIGNDAETDPQQMLFYLKRAFAETARQQIRVTPMKPDALNETVLRNASFAVVAAALPNTSAVLLNTAVTNGLTVLAALRSPEEAQALASIAGKSVTAEEGPSSGYAMLAEIDFTHPLLAPFADARFSDFTKIHFWKHRVMKFEATNSHVLAKFDDGSPALAQFSAGKGSVFVLAAGWNPSDSQFALSSKFVPLLYSLLELSGAIKAQSLAFMVGDPVSVASLHATNTLTVRKPDGSKVQLGTEKKSFTETDTPGLYTMTGIEPPFRFAVNLAPEESRTVPMPLEQLEQLGVPVRLQLVATPERVARKEAQMKAAELESRQKLWRWLIAATLVVLIVETWIATRLSRRVAVQAESTA